MKGSDELDDILRTVFKGETKKKSLVVHLGPPKTGTSAIQRVLFNNKSKLASQDWLYPVTGVDERDPRHQFLVQFLVGGNIDPVVAFLKEIKEDKNKNVFITSEGLYFNRHRMIIDFFEVFSVLHKFFNITFLLAVRDPDELAFSLYKQCIGAHPVANHPLFAFGGSFRCFLEHPLTSFYLDVDGFVAKAAQKKFPVKCVQYSKSILATIENDILNVVLDDKDKVVNCSPGHIFLEVMLARNMLIGTREVSERKDFSKFIRTGSYSDRYREKLIRDLKVIREIHPCNFVAKDMECVRSLLNKRIRQLETVNK